MAQQVPIQYEQLVELVEQLPEAQQKDLIRRLLTHQARQRPLTVDEKLQLMDTIKLNAEVNEEPSVRRVDWYGDDGR